MNRILIVDTNPFFADILACALDVANHDVTAASSAAEGIRLAATGRFNLVVAAWFLRGDKYPGELCQRIWDASPHANVIIITARDELVSEAIRQCRGAIAILAKPFHREDLLAAVHEALHGETFVPSVYPLSAPMPRAALHTLTCEVTL
jgi:two-component system, OmpR family, response regulator